MAKYETVDCFSLKSICSSVRAKSSFVKNEVLYNKILYENLTFIEDLHEEAMKGEEQIIKELRDELKQVKGSTELRIGSLEGKISELCSMISNYENNNIHSYNSAVNNLNSISNLNQIIK